MSIFRVQIPYLDTHASLHLREVLGEIQRQGLSAQASLLRFSLYLAGGTAGLKVRHSIQHTVDNHQQLVYILDLPQVIVIECMA
jgi:hypothetical protein